MENLKLSVGEFIALTNQTLEFAYPGVDIEGEVASFKVNQGKFVFFDLKDSEGSVGCFMMVFNLRIPIEDGMKVVVRAVPKLTNWGKFSLTVQQIRPSGEGSLKKSFELLRAKLDKEGLFALDRKRALPALSTSIGVVSSTSAAGYGDFMKILENRWGGIDISVAQVQVQGSVAPDQMIGAIKYFNQLEQTPEVIVIIRGGGSADDLSAFNDELLVREVAGSRIPVLAGIGHEIDVSLVDLAADVRASTPSNAAEILVPDKRDVQRSVDDSLRHALFKTNTAIDSLDEKVDNILHGAIDVMSRAIETKDQQLQRINDVLRAVNPANVLARGYSIIRGDQSIGSVISIETLKTQLTAEVTHVTKK